MREPSCWSALSMTVSRRRLSSSPVSPLSAQRVRDTELNFASLSFQATKALLVYPPPISEAKSVPLLVVGVIFWGKLIHDHGFQSLAEISPSDQDLSDPTHPASPWPGNRRRRIGSSQAATPSRRQPPPSPWWICKMVGAKSLTSMMNESAIVN